MSVYNKNLHGSVYGSEHEHVFEMMKQKLVCTNAITSESFVDAFNKYTSHVC